MRWGPSQQISLATCKQMPAKTIVKKIIRKLDYSNCLYENVLLSAILKAVSVCSKYYVLT